MYQALISTLWNHGRQIVIIHNINWPLTINARWGIKHYSKICSHHTSCNQLMLLFINGDSVTKHLEKKFFLIVTFYYETNWLPDLTLSINTLKDKKHINRFDTSISYINNYDTTLIKSLRSNNTNSLKFILELND